jgi:hypothetical protein
VASPKLVLRQDEVLSGRGRSPRCRGPPHNNSTSCCREAFERLRGVRPRAGRLGSRGRRLVPPTELRAPSPYYAVAARRHARCRAASERIARARSAGSGGTWTTVGGERAGDMAGVSARPMRIRGDLEWAGARWDFRAGKPRRMV